MNIVNSFCDPIKLGNGAIGSIDDIKSVVCNATDSYKKTTGNVRHADLIFNLLKECLEGIIRLQNIQSEGNVLTVVYFFGRERRPITAYSLIDFKLGLKEDYVAAVQSLV